MSFRHVEKYITKLLFLRLFMQEMHNSLTVPHFFHHEVSFVPNGIIIIIFFPPTTGLEPQFSHSPESEFVEVSAFRPTRPSTSTAAASSATSSSASSATAAASNSAQPPTTVAQRVRLSRRSLAQGHHSRRHVSRAGDSSTEVLVNRDGSSRHQQGGGGAHQRLRHLRELFNTRLSLLNQIEYLRSAGEMLDEQDEATTPEERLAVAERGIVAAYSERARVIERERERRRGVSRRSENLGRETTR